MSEAERIEALEAALADLRRQVEMADLGDLRRTADRMRELLLDFAQLIDQSMTLW